MTIDKDVHTPSPGSDAAINAGCTCAVIDNAHGRGYMGRPGIFVINEGCPLHGISISEDRMFDPTPDEKAN